jgi:hypothetical protein
VSAATAALRCPGKAGSEEAGVAAGRLVLTLP